MKVYTSVSSLLEEKHQKSTLLPFFIDQISQLEKKMRRRIKHENELNAQTN